MGSTNRTSAFVQRHRYWALTLLGLIVAWSLAYTIIGAVCGAAAIIYIDNNGDGAPYNTWSPGLLTAYVDSKSLCPITFLLELLANKTCLQRNYLLLDYYSSLLVLL